MLNPFYPTLHCRGSELPGIPSQNKEEEAANSSHECSWEKVVTLLFMSFCVLLPLALPSLALGCSLPGNLSTVGRYCTTYLFISFPVGSDQSCSPKNCDVLGGSDWNNNG